jgi:hypothetical protein
MLTSCMQVFDHQVDKTKLNVGLKTQNAQYIVGRNALDALAQFFPHNLCTGMLAGYNVGGKRMGIWKV